MAESPFVPPRPDEWQGPAASFVPPRPDEWQGPAVAAAATPAGPPTGGAWWKNAATNVWNTGKQAVTGHAVESLGGSTVGKEYDRAADAFSDYGARAVNKVFGHGTSAQLNKDFGTQADILRGAGKIIPNLIDATLFTPLGAGTAALGLSAAAPPAASAAVGAGFGTDMSVTAGKAVQKARQDPTSENIREATTAVGSAALPVAHAVTGGYRAGKSAVGDLLTGTPEQLAVKAIKPSPADSDFTGKLVPDNANPGKFVWKDNIKPVRNDIQGHGGVPEIAGNRDMIQAGLASINHIQDNVMGAWIKDAQKKGTEFPMAEFGKAAGDSIPLLDQYDDPAGTRKFAQEELAKWQTVKLPVDKVRQLLIDVNAKLRKFYDKSTGEQNATVIAGERPFATLTAQADALRKILYEGMDPANGGAGPRDAQARSGQIKNWIDYALRNTNVIAGEKPISPAGAYGKTAAAAVEMFGAPFKGDVEGAAAKLLHPKTGPTDAHIKRLFKGAENPEPFAMPPAGAAPPPTQTPGSSPPPGATPPTNAVPGSTPPPGAASGTPAPLSPAAALAATKQMIAERNAISMRKFGIPYADHPRTAAGELRRSFIRNEQQGNGGPTDYQSPFIGGVPPTEEPGTSPLPPPAAPAPEPPVPAAQPVAAAEPERSVQSVEWKDFKNPELNASLGEGSTRVNYKGGLEKLEKVPLDKIDPEAGNRLYPDKVAEYMDKPSPFAPELRIRPEGRYQAYEGHHRLAALKAKEMGLSSDDVRAMERDPDESQASKALQDKLAEGPAKKGDTLAWTSEGDEQNYPKVPTPEDGRAAGQIAANPPEPEKPGAGAPIKANTSVAEGERQKVILGFYEPGAPGVTVEANDSNPRMRSVVYRDTSGKPQGYLSFYLNDDLTGVAPPEHGLYPGVYVSPEFRRTGIATKLYDEARKQGFDLSKVSGTETTPSGAAFLNDRRAKVAGAPNPRPTPDVDNNQPAAPAAGEKAPAYPTGNTTSVMTPRGTNVDVQYAVVDASQPVVSHDLAGNENPAYPAERQPRDRTRVASQAQIEGIAQTLNPIRVASDYRATDGAPIVDSNLIVEAGNGRMNGIKQAYAKYPEKAEAYRRFLLKEAANFGLKPEDITGVKQPVLVRVRKSAVDPAQFAAESNEPWTAAMSAGEQARLDAQRMSPQTLGKFTPAESGQIIHPGNRDFVRSFMDQVISPAERSRYQQADGSISQEGVTRIRNAIFARAYGETGALEKLAESTDSNIKNITNGMLSAAPRFVNIQEGIKAGNLHPGLDLAPDIASAVGKLSSLRERGTPVSDYLNQLAMFDDGVSPEARDILTVFDKHNRSPRKIGKILASYADGVEGAGDPRQAGMFGRMNPPTKGEILEAAVKQTDKEFSNERPAQERSAQERSAKSPRPVQAVEAVRQESSGNGQKGNGADGSKKPQPASGSQAQLGFDLGPGTPKPPGVR